MQQRAYASQSSQPRRFPPIFPSADGISPEFQPKPVVFVFTPSAAYIRNGELALSHSPTPGRIVTQLGRARLRKPKDCRSVIGLLLGCWRREQWRLAGRRSRKTWRRRRHCSWTRPRAHAAWRSSLSRRRSRKSSPRRTLLYYYSIFFSWLGYIIAWGLVLNPLHIIGWIHETVPRNAGRFRFE